MGAGVRSPLLGVAGAVRLGEDDQSVTAVAHFGEPFREQRFLATGRAIASLDSRCVVTVSGPDRLDWLNALSSQQLVGLQPGASAETLFLDPNGRIRYAAGLLDDGQTSYLLLERLAAPGLVELLRKLRFRKKVEIDLATERFHLIGSFGQHPDVRSARGAVGPLVWHDPWPGIVDGGYGYAAPPEEPWDWYEQLVEASELDRLVALAEGGALAVAGALAVDALRVAANRPAQPNELDAKTLPHELDWMRTAVNLAKGCYSGQETVAKLHNLGHPPRRLTLLYLDGSLSVLPDAGAPVFLVGEREQSVGTITSAANHFELGPIALALLKRKTAADVGLECEVAGDIVTASQQVIVPPDAGSVRPAPRFARRATVTRRRQVD